MRKVDITLSWRISVSLFANQDSVPSYSHITQNTSSDFMNQRSCIPPHHHHFYESFREYIFFFLRCFTFISVKISTVVRGSSFFHEFCRVVCTVFVFSNLKLFLHRQHLGEGFRCKKYLKGRGVHFRLTIRTTQG